MKKIRCLIISDTHGKHKQLEKQFTFPSADILIHAGDITPSGDDYQVKDFLEWFGNFKKYDYEHRIFIAGNHDFLFERKSLYAKSLIPIKKGIIYLEDSGIEIEGIKFWGSPITPIFFNWAFMKPLEKRMLHWEAIPDDTNILITHGAPYGILDHSEYRNENAGCTGLLSNVMERIKPLVHIMGHLHSNYGTYQKNNTLFINASNLNDRYAVSNKPILIEIDKENNYVKLINDG